MTADRELIFWIAIVCVVVSSASSSSVIEGNNNGVCKKNLSYLVSRRIDYTATRETVGWFNIHYNESYRAYNTTYVKMWTIKDTCCKNYKKDNGTCKPQCSSPCMNGYCGQPDTCECNPGWKGDLCNEVLLCIVDFHSAEVVTMVPIEEKAANASDDPLDESTKIDRCLPQCRDQIDSANLTIRQSANTKYYLIPANSSCNTISGDQMFGRTYIVSGIVIGIMMLLLIVLGAVYIVRRERKPKTQINDKPTESIYNDVISMPDYRSYVEPKTRLYDDVIAPSNDHYDEINLKPINHYDIVIE